MGKLVLLNLSMVDVAEANPERVVVIENVVRKCDEKI